MKKQSSLFYVVWITALIVFFSPFVGIYLIVKAAHKIGVLFQHRGRKVDVVDPFRPRTEVPNL